MKDPATKPQGQSRYALKQRQPIEATHAYHKPPVSWCKLCQPGLTGQ